MEVFLVLTGIQIRVYDLTRDGVPIGLWFINWKGIARVLWTHLTRKQFTVFAGMSVEDWGSYGETGDRPLGYDG